MLGRTRIHTRARGSGAGAGSATTTPLQRILALSPSALYWPANGSGWQGTSGGTLAATGQPVGLLPDLSQLGGKTLAEWLAAPTTSELVNLASLPTPSIINSAGSVGVWNAGTRTMTNTGSVVATHPRFAFDFGLVPGRAYVVSGTLSGSITEISLIRLALAGAAQSLSYNSATGGFSGVVSAATSSIEFVTNLDGAESLTIASLSIRELPGNHLRAGTWASPADSSRALLTAGGALNFDGVNDYYSLLNAISITTNMTVVRAFKRASAGIRSVGVGGSSAVTPREFNWGLTNGISQALGATAYTAVTLDTATGAFVSAAVRSGSTELTRLNGAQLNSRAAATVSGSFNTLGRLNTDYNNGEISFLAVFPTELTGANLALVEQIAAATNGATLA